MVPRVTLHVKRLRLRNVYHKMLAEKAQAFGDGGGFGAIAPDGVCWAQRQQFLLDAGNLLPAQIAQRQLLAEGEQFARSEIAIVSLVILNDEIFAKGKQFLAKLIQHRYDPSFRMRADTRHPAAASPRQKKQHGIVLSHAAW